MADHGPWTRIPDQALDPGFRARARASGEPGLRCYQRDVDDGHLQVLVALCADPEFDRPRWHLSISHRTYDHPPRPGRYPAWDEITEARYRFVPDSAYMVMMLPPRGEYVNVHRTAFHLWEITKGQWNA